MQNRRVALTLAEGDYTRLVAAAEADGKSPSTYASDILKAFLFRPLFNGFGEHLQAPRGADQTPALDLRTKTLPGVPEAPLNRQARRAREREAKKRK